MNEYTNILSPSELMLTFIENTSAYGVVFLGGLNPFAIKVNGEEWYVYIKNLSPVQLSNGISDDAWRIQLPHRDDFDKIKDSASKFLLLGYDANNDVYTTWNPAWCKQRLNVGKNVSLYSLLSLQQEVSQEGVIKTLLLNNDGLVVCIPAKQLYSYIENIKEYYPVETTFEAKDSSIQKRTSFDAESLFNLFLNIGDCSGFVSYLKKVGKTNRSITDYIRNLNYIMDSGLIEKHKDLFLQYSRIREYFKAVCEFKELADVEPIDKQRHGYIRTALNHYVRYLMESINSNYEFPAVEEECTSLVCEPSFEIDEYGKLTSLDDDIKEKLMPLIKGVDYPDYEEMITIAIGYYPSNVTDKMTPVDWISLFEGTEWKKSRRKSEDNAANSARRRMPKRAIRITLENGDTIQRESATKTYLYVFESYYPDLIIDINFGDLVIDKVRMPDYPNTVRTQVQLSNGYYVSTNFDTKTKAKILQRISDELDLNFKIEVI